MNVKTQRTVLIKDRADIPPQISGRRVTLIKRSDIAGYSWITSEDYHIRERWIEKSKVPELYKQKLKALL